MSGYIGSPRQWVQFGKNWAAILDEAGVPYFHATQFFSSRPRGPYRGWSNEKAKTFIDALLGTIHRHRLCPIGAGVDVPAFNALTIGERRFLTGAFLRGKKPITSGAPTKPYYLAFQYLVVEATGRAKEGSSVNFTFDRQNVLEARAVETFHQYVSYMNDKVRREKLGRISFDDKTKIPGLQAADMLTHLWYKYMEQRDKMSGNRRYALQALTRKRGAMRLFDAERLEELLSGLSPVERDRIRAAS